VLFDKVVIPIPTEPIKSVTAQEIERLSADIDYLEKEGIAVGVEWDRTKFEAWRETHAGEAIAQLIDKDRQLATRMEVQESIKNDSEGKFSSPGKTVRAIPVYADWQEFDSAWKGWAPMQVFDIVARQLSMPADDVALEDIVELLRRKRFSESMSGLLRWQDAVIFEFFK
jgi:hypothetical protein